MNQRFLFKTLFQVIVICILVYGVALANTDCLIVCCGHCESQDLPFGSAHPEHDMQNDCSSGSKTPQCHLTLDFAPAVEEFDSSTNIEEEHYTAINFATFATGDLLSNQLNQYSTLPIKLQIRAPDVPLFIRSLSLLF
jgi:hypothetical protein